MYLARLLPKAQAHWVAIRVLNGHLWLLDSEHHPSVITFDELLAYVATYRHAFLVESIPLNTSLVLTPDRRGTLTACEAERRAWLAQGSGGLLCLAWGDGRRYRYLAPKVTERARACRYSSYTQASRYRKHANFKFWLFTIWQ